MTATATHDPAPLFECADNCDHPEPDDDTSRAWSDWDADHPECRDIGERVCELTRLGSFCPACTEIARKDYELADCAYIDAGDCVHVQPDPEVAQ